ncbi:hypothetical protein Scep_005797 [Stephania cephalantha]|uniref:Wound-induced protein 1 n=1 Tax=Stephania cephalantha TaxID=152367 RepID=A0AAP0KV06_9MAGN
MAAELANLEEIPHPNLESSNIRVVEALYEALRGGDVDTVQRLLAPDLEWWFHGPPTHQHLMLLLTGHQPSSFSFNPTTVKAIGNTVLAEGCDPDCSVTWVHAWTVDHGLMITQVREYFNTSLTVTRITHNSPSSIIRCQNLWQSTLPNTIGKSVPGLVLAI